jgi:hypothetical protein
MPIAYKYCGPTGIAILQHLELKVTPPDEFNDLFEFLPSFICSNEQAYYALCRKRNPELRNNWIDFYRTIADIPEILRRLENNHLRTISKTLGVLCMSKRADSLQMWGHYAKSHKGFVIGFDTSADIFQGLRDVRYFENRPVFDISRAEEWTHITEVRPDLCFAKSAKWRYEEEQRAIFHLAQLKTRRKGLWGPKSYYLPFPPDAVHSVILGAKCTVRLATGITAIVAAKMPRAVVSRASRDNNEYAVTWRSV